MNRRSILKILIGKRAILDLSVIFGRIKEISALNELKEHSLLS